MLSQSYVITELRATQGMLSYFHEMKEIAPQTADLALRAKSSETAFARFYRQMLIK
jgi:hypothetical protein